MGNTDIFEAMASGYDTPERVRVAEVAANAIRTYIVDGQNKDAIDFGCGTGLVGLHLLDDFRHIVFWDTSPNMLDKLNHKLRIADIRNAETLCFDLETGSLPDQRADYVFMSQVLLHIPDIEPVLSRLYDILNPGGHLVIVDFDKNDKVRSDKVHNGFDREELTALLSRIGYQALSSTIIYSGSKLFMNQDADLFILDGVKSR